MNIGKIPESVLKRVCLQNTGTRRPEVTLHAGIGEDCAALSLSEDEELVLSTDPITGTVMDIGRLSVIVTVNDLASAGAEPLGIMLTVLLPDGTDEEALRRIMADVNASCETAGIEILGGHTEVTAAVNQPLLSVTGVGKVKRAHLTATAFASPGMALILTKWIALEGTSIIAKEREEELKAHLPGYLIDDAKAFDRYLSVQKEAGIAASHGAAAMHDVTEGGIYGALWEMAEASGTGLSVELKSIPIRQETVEICEHFGIDPYKLISSGSLLIATADAPGLLMALAKEEIPAALIGRVTSESERVLTYESGRHLPGEKGEQKKRFLTPPGADELYKVV